MKKAKIMLTALIVLTVVGGALAFKAQKAFDGNLRCTFIETTTNVVTDIACTEIAYRTTLPGVGEAGYCTFTAIPATTEPCFKLTVNLDL